MSRRHTQWGIFVTNDPLSSRHHVNTLFARRHRCSYHPFDMRPGANEVLAAVTFLSSSSVQNEEAVRGM